MSGLPGVYDLKIYQGDAFRFAVTISDGAAPRNLTGHTAQAQIRKDVSAVVSIAFACTIEAAEGRVEFYLTGAQTRALPRTAIWDFQLTDTDGDTQTYLRGQVSVSREVTR